jgi:hypothetical protein
MPSRSGHPRTPHPLASVRYRKRSPDRWPLVWCRHRWYARASWRCSRSLGWARTQAMAGRSTARTSSPVSPPSRRPGRSPRSQPPMTARAVACGSTPTLAQVSVGQARWSPPPAVLVPDRVDELAGEHHPVGVEREPDHQRAQPRPDHLDGLAETHPHLQRAEHADGHVAGHVRHSAGVTPPRERDLRQRAGRAARVGPGPVGTGPTRPPPWPPGKVAPLMVTVTEPGAGSIGRSPNLCRFSPSSSPSRPGRAAWRTASPRRGWRRRPSRRCAGCARRPSSGRSAACRRCP